MLARIFELIRGQVVGSPSSFERYVRNLHYRNGSAAPTREEARTDYYDMHRYR